MCVPLDMTDEKYGSNGEPVIDQPPAFVVDGGTTAPAPAASAPAAPQNTTINSSGGVQTETPTGGAGGGGPDESGSFRQTEGSGFNQPNIPQPAAFDPIAAQMAAQASMFSQLTKDIMAGQKEAANAMREGFLSLTEQQQKALAAADELRKNTGQASRKPNYSLSLKNNARNNRGGITSTMLTGVGGIATGDLPLGKTNLLGA